MGRDVPIADAETWRKAYVNAEREIASLRAERDEARETIEEMNKPFAAWVEEQEKRWLDFRPGDHIFLQTPNGDVSFCLRCGLGDPDAGQGCLERHRARYLDAEKENRSLTQDLAESRERLQKAEEFRERLLDGLRHAISRNHQFVESCDGCKRGLDIIWERVVPPMQAPRARDSGDSAEAEEKKG